MKKLLIALTLTLSFLAFSSSTNAQTPTAWGVGALFQTNDANFLLGYTAIETNQPVFQVYDCEVDAFVFANGSLIGAPFSTGINFAEIGFSSPATFNTLYEMVFQFFLLPVDFCGGTIDYFGFSTLWGGDYTSPFAWEGTGPIVCFSLPAILLGRFLFSGFVLPTLSLDSVTLDPPTTTSFISTGTIKLIVTVSASRGLPPNTIVVLRPSAPGLIGAASISLQTTPPDFCDNDCKMTGGGNAETRNFTFSTKFTLTSPTFPVKFKIRVATDPPPANAPYMLISDPFKDSAEVTITGN
jgi:hypothetical protein